MKVVTYNFYWFVLAILLSFAYCGQTSKRVNRIEPSVGENLNGYWILTNYIDDILKTKSIAPHISKRLTWDAIIIHIHGDSLNTHGLIMSGKFLLSNKTDSLTTIKGVNYYKLSYNKSLNQIRATAANDKSDKQDTVTYYFRRVRQDEQRLIAGIDGKPFFQNLEHNLYDYFIDSIISGIYRPLTKTKDFSTFVIGKDNRTSGFKNYNYYSIHDYFGTLHPYNMNDVMMFEDTTITPSENFPPTNIVYYSWTFRGDTLLLTEMLTEDYENYYLGTKTYKLLRKSNTADNKKD